MKREVKIKCDIDLNKNLENLKGQAFKVKEANITFNFKHIILVLEEIPKGEKHV